MPAKAKHKLIIDTNLWISFLLTSDYSKVDPLFADNSINFFLARNYLTNLLKSQSGRNSENIFH
jgi:hypothetical protein